MIHSIRFYILAGESLLQPIFLDFYVSIPVLLQMQTFAEVVVCPDFKTEF